MTENGILDAPTFVATPEYTDGLNTAQEIFGTKPGGFALKAGEKNKAALQGVRDGAVMLPTIFASPPGRSMARQVATVRKMKAAAASAKPPAAKPIGPRLSNSMDFVGKAPAPRLRPPPRRRR